MTIATHPLVSAGVTTNGHEPADVLVVFGITGDLAKVMTFQSLYRLEQRGLVAVGRVARRHLRMRGNRHADSEPPRPSSAITQRG